MRLSKLFNESENNDRISPVYSLDQLSPELISSREDSLKDALIKLKRDFVGLDDIIDRIGRRVYGWYVLPETLSRPTVLCLWGMTGVGKSDLVRKLASYLVVDGYFEMQMTGGTGHERVRHEIVEANVETQSRSILFFDEMQRFSTKDESGSTIRGASYQDLWELLSDGTLTVSENDIKSAVSDILSNLPAPVGYWTPESDDDDDDDDGDIPLVEGTSRKKGSKTPPKLTTWSRRTIAEVIGTPVNTIPVRATEELLEKVRSCNKVNRLDYRSSLIILGGNLDSAYNHLPEHVTANWLMADWNYNRSLEVTVLDVKEALLRQYAPEQVARFGNSHVIYPALTKENFEEVVNREIASWERMLQNTFGLCVKTDKSIHELVIRNGCYPTQGVRPLFSTCQEVLEGIAGPLILRTYLADRGVTDFRALYDGSCIRIEYGQGQSVQEPFLGDIDAAYRKTMQRPTLDAVCIHEAGHAVASYEYLGVVPELCVLLPEGGGTTFYVDENSAQVGNAFNSLRCLMAGYVAERIFGYNTLGSARDIEEATKEASKLVRGFGGALTKYGCPTSSATARASKTMEERVLTLSEDEQSSSVNRILADAHREVQELFKMRPVKAKIRLIADALKEGKSLSKDQLREILLRG